MPPKSTEKASELDENVKFMMEKFGLDEEKAKLAIEKGFRVEALRDGSAMRQFVEDSGIAAGVNRAVCQSFHDLFLSSELLSRAHISISAARFSFLNRCTFMTRLRHPPCHFFFHSCLRAFETSSAVIFFVLSKKFHAPESAGSVLFHPTRYFVKSSITSPEHMMLSGKYFWAAAFKLAG